MNSRLLVNRLAGLLFVLLWGPGYVLAQNGNDPYLRLTLYTGGDDLRNGQNVLATLYTNVNMGPGMADVNINDGRGSGNNSNFSFVFPMGSGWKPSDFKGIKIAHDGNGRNAFEGYDNWNLDRIRVVFIDPNASPRQTIMLDLSGQPLIRFTGDKRAHSWKFMPANSVSDLSGGGSTSRRTMNDNDVSFIIQSQYSTVGDPLQAMLVKIKQTGSLRSMASAQARRIVASYKEESGKMTLARTCFSYVSDRDQFPGLVDLFQSSNLIRQFEAEFGRVNTSSATTNTGQATTYSGNNNANTPPVGSPRSAAQGEINGKFVRVRYSKVAVRGRDVWSTIAPYGKIWRTGANEATTITFDRDVTIGHQTKVPSGTYSLFTIPGPTNWTIILNRNNQLWGTQGYNASDDVVRHYEDVRPHDYTEQLTFDVISDGIMLRWEKMEVFIPVQ
ncbi:hypothetical protein GCM10028807_21420 [Spirosoma daeguense]